MKNTQVRNTSSLKHRKKPQRPSPLLHQIKERLAMSDALKSGVRKIRLYMYSGYKVVYIANRDVTTDAEIADIPLDKMIRGGPCMLAVVPEECKDYDLLIGMEPEEALELLREEKYKYVAMFHSEKLYNGVYRRISGDWDEYGYWSVVGSLPDLFDEKEEEP